MNVDDIRIAFDSGSLTTLKIVLGLILFGIAMDTKLSDFRLALRKPKAFAVAIVAQFALLPALTFLLTLILGVQGSVALGMILVACCPPGNVSNILTHRAGGDVALSVSMTAVGNVIAIFMLPINFSLWGHLHPTGREYFNEISVAPWDMLSEVVLVIALPFALGLVVSHLLPRVAARSHRVVGILSFLALGGIILVAVANNWALFVGYIGVVALAVFLHDALALGLGYSIARGFALDVPARKAMTFEVCGATRAPSSATSASCACAVATVSTVTPGASAIFAMRRPQESSTHDTTRGACNADSGRNNAALALK